MNERTKDKCVCLHKHWHKHWLMCVSLGRKYEYFWLKYSNTQSCESWICTSSNKISFLITCTFFLLIFPKYLLSQVGWEVSECVCVRFNFKEIYLWASVGPPKDIHIVVLKPFQDSFSRMFQIIVLWERRSSFQSNLLEIAPEELPVFRSIHWSFCLPRQLKAEKTLWHNPTITSCCAEACDTAIYLCPVLVWQCFALQQKFRLLFITSQDLSL